MQKQADIWKPALISGALFGFLSGVPIVNALNCACCSLIVGAGVWSSYMVIRGSLEPVAYGRAALAGLAAAIFALPVVWLTQGVIMILSPVDLMEQLRESIDQASGVSPEFAESAEMIETMGLPMIMAFFGMVQACFFTIFGTLGGVIGRALFEKRSPLPPAAPMPGAGPIDPGASPPPAYS